MKKTLLIAVALALGVVASQAQGLVSIALTGGILASTNGAALGKGTGKIVGTGTAGYYFELLYSPNVAAPPAFDITSGSLAQWTDSGVLGTSQTSLNAGRIFGGSSVAANGWTLPGASYDNERAIDVIGWSGNYGTTYAQFLNSLSIGLGNFGPGYYGFASGLNYAGGGSSALPAVDMWGNQTTLSGAGLNNGIVLYAVTPEPGTMALAALGGLSLLAFRRKK